MHHELKTSPPLGVRIYGPLLSQLLDNLLENACKYSAPGTPFVVRVWRDGGSAYLGVEDRGCGLGAEDAQHVFEPFFRTEQAIHDGQSGVGLGLAVAARIATKLGGSLDLRSEPGVGSLFTLRLPEVPMPGSQPDGVSTPGPVKEIASRP
jgi:signal transduction histidine kinase